MKKVFNLVITPILFFVFVALANCNMMAGMGLLFPYDSGGPTIFQAFCGVCLSVVGYCFLKVAGSLSQTLEEENKEYEHA